MFTLGNFTNSVVNNQSSEQLTRQDAY